MFSTSGTSAQGVLLLFQVIKRFLLFILNDSLVTTGSIE